MTAGVPVVTRGAGAVSDTVGDAALVLAAADPSYVAAALHRVCTDERAARHVDGRGRRRAAELSGDRGRPHRRRHRRGGGTTVSKKVAFVTPRYGPQIMGGAETAVRQLAEHLRALTRLGGRGPHDLRARRHHLGRRAGAGHDRDQRRDRAPSSLRARPPAGLLRPRRDGPAGPALGDAGAGRAVGRLQRPRLARAGRCRGGLGRRRRRLLPRTCTTRPWRPSARCGCRRCSTRPRTTSPPCTCRCSAAPSATPTPSASTRRRSACSSSGCTRWPSARRSCSGSAWASPKRPGRPGARGRRAGRPAVHRQRRARRRAQGLQDAGHRTSPPTRSGIRGRWRWCWSVRSPSSCRRTPTSS